MATKCRHCGSTSYAWCMQLSGVLAIAVFAFYAHAAEAGNEPVVVEFKSKADVEKKLFSAKDVTKGWGAHQVSRGGTTMSLYTERTYDMEGDVVGTYFSKSVSSHSGSVIAVPIGDFELKRYFQYEGVDRENHKRMLNGVIVAVQIQISAGNGSPADMVMQRSVENLVKSGAALAPSVGAKSGRTMPLKESAKRRFGARTVKERYNATAGEVVFILYDCDSAFADDTYFPSTRAGLSKDQRKAEAVKLSKSEDKSHFTVFSTEKEIIPVGSRHVPFNGEDCVRVF